jgi:ribonuclease Z
LWPSFPVRIHEIQKPEVVYDHGSFQVEAKPLNHRVKTWGYALEEADRPGRFDIGAARELEIPEGPMYGRLQGGEAIELEDGRVIDPDQVLGPDRPGFKLAYCSDTRPCDSTRELAEGADVLIHEATYPEGEEALAHQRGHSTAADAARCASHADVRRLFLTHISQRYTNLDAYATAVQDIFPNTQAARDLMTVELSRRDDT